MRTNAGAQATVDSSVASQKALEAQLLGAKASVETSKINLDYTRILAPIDGKLSRTTHHPRQRRLAVVRHAGSLSSARIRCT